MPARDWRELFQQYKGQWVALADDRKTAVAHGKSRREVEQRATELGYPDLLMVHLPDKLTAFAS